MRVIVPFLLCATLAGAAEKITFTETIAPIVYQNCVSCHRPGEAAPFSLISYDDVRKRGTLIAQVTQSRYMPPWHAEHGYGEFEGERRLSNEQIATMAEWVKQGMPEGDRARMPKLPQFTEGWQLGKPDLILEMPAAYEVPASGPDIYRNFAIPTGVAEDKYVRAVEFRPSARKAVHHALFAYVPTGAMKNQDGRDGKPGFAGMNGLGAGASVQPAINAGNAVNSSGELGGWAVGAIPRFFADEQALPLAKNSDFIVQMHFHPTGKAESERSSIGLYFASKAPPRKMLAVGIPAVFAVGSSLDIPAGAANYSLKDSTTLPVDVRAIGISAHAHYLGKEFKATATLPDGSTRPLLWIKDWDFNWQEQYAYKEPFLLPKGTRIDVAISYDNSAANPHNPSSPPRRVLWGEQSLDEMGGVGLMVTVLREEDEATLAASLTQSARAAIANGGRDGTVKRILESQARSRAVAAARLQDITLFDREGKPVRTIGEPGIFNQPALSPDGTRVAVIKSDRQTGNADVWVYDIATGKGTAITADSITDSAPVWSADGKQVAWVGSITDGNYSAIYRRAADGSGVPELVHKFPTGENPILTDWSAEGTLCFWSGEWTYGLPASAASNTPVQLAKGRGGRFSPDGRLLAFNSNQSGRFEVYTVQVKPSIGTPVQITKNGAIGGLFWRQDGKELFFLASPSQVLSAIDPTTAETAEQPLFKVPPMLAPAQVSNIATRDGQRFVFLAQQR
jgi:WD40-like Beta Propeller Repeat